MPTPARDILRDLVAGGKRPKPFRRIVGQLADAVANLCIAGYELEALTEMVAEHYPNLRATDAFVFIGAVDRKLSEAGLFRPGHVLLEAIQRLDACYSAAAPEDPVGAAGIAVKKVGILGIGKTSFGTVDDTNAEAGQEAANARAHLASINVGPPEAPLAELARLAASAVIHLRSKMRLAEKEKQG